MAASYKLDSRRKISPSAKRLPKNFFTFVTRKQDAVRDKKYRKTGADILFSAHLSLFLWHD